MTATNRVALAIQFAIIPLYGALAGLAAETPGIPPLVPRPAAALIGLLALGALIVTAPAAARTFRRDWLTFAFLVPGLATILNGVVGFDPAASIGLGLLVTGIGAAGLYVARRADAAMTRLALRCFLWSGLAASLLALAMMLSRRPAGIYAYAHGRAIGTFLNPNELAAYTLIGLAVAVPLAVGSRGRDRLATVCALVFLVTLAATFSRWGALSAVCGVAVYAIVAKARVLLVAALVVALAGVALNAVAGAGHHNPRDDESRTVAWRTGWTTFQRFPLLGVGAFAYVKTYDEMRPPNAPGGRSAVAFDAHSLPISFAADGGIIAIVAAVMSFVILLRAALRAAGGAAAQPRMLAYALAAGMIALQIDGAINMVSMVFPLSLQVAMLSLAVLRTDALR